MSRKTMMEQALEHAGRGWRIFPVIPATPDGKCPCSNPACTSPGKHPQIKAWQQNATTDEVQIREWWTRWPHHNVGIATGKESNLLVLDADGAVGLLAIEERGLPETPPSVRTGRIDGGTHFYFSAPTEFDARNFAGKVKGLDARGDGGYVIGAGSRHATGSTYEWINHIEEYEPPPPPRWLVDLLVGGKTRDGENALEGGRNALLFAQARRLRAVDGYSPDALLDIMLRWNAEHCIPPLDEHEVRQIVDNACKEEYAAGPDLTAELHDKEFGRLDIVGSELRTYPLTQVGNAEIFVKLLGHNMKYVPEEKNWRVWSGSHWGEDRSNASRRGMMLTIRARAASASFIPDREERTQFFAWCRSQEAASQIDGALKAAASMNSVVALVEEFDTHPMILGLRDTTYDLEDDQAKPPNRLDLLTKRVGAEWDAEATCPLWLKTLDEVFQGDRDKVDYFQRAVGYSMTGSNLEQCMFICHGRGANGKSTVLGVIRDMAGDYGASARYETFNADLASSKGDDLAMLRGKRFVLVVEPDQNAKLAEGRVKQITGGTDKITCRHLYGKDFSYTPEFKLWYAVNHLPRIRGTDDGIWRRIHLIPFEAQFMGDQRDNELPEKLAAEMPGILNWALEGAAQWRKTGLRPPTTVVKATSAYRHDSDVLQLWIDDCAVEDKTKTTTQAELYMSYANWCGDNGLRASSATYFGKSLAERGFTKSQHPKTNRPVYRGITLSNFGGDF